MITYLPPILIGYTGSKPYAAPGRHHHRTGQDPVPQQRAQPRRPGAPRCGRGQGNRDAIHFLLETNPGPGLGLLVAFFVASKGMLKDSAFGSMIIHFLGGIHEIYFPYVLAPPIMILSVISGGVAADLWFVISGAGVVNLSNVYLSNAQYTGTSGLTIHDQTMVMDRRVAGTLSPGRSVAAIGGLPTAAEAIEAVEHGRFPGKVIVFPQIQNLPLLGLKELAERLPEVGAKLGEDFLWTKEAEEVLIEKFWEKP